MKAMNKTSECGHENPPTVQNSFATKLRTTLRAVDESHSRKRGTWCNECRGGGRDCLLVASRISSRSLQICDGTQFRHPRSFNCDLLCNQTRISKLTVKNLDKNVKSQVGGEKKAIQHDARKANNHSLNKFAELAHDTSDGLSANGFQRLDADPDGLETVRQDRSNNPRRQLVSVPTNISRGKGMRADGESPTALTVSVANL